MPIPQDLARAARRSSPKTTQLARPRATLLRRAWWLAVFTVAWNLAEGRGDHHRPTRRSRALIGFGVDSFIESASASVLIWRPRAERRSPERAEHVEQRALKIIGVTFLGLAALVGVESIRSSSQVSSPT